MRPLPIGKIPFDLLDNILSSSSAHDPRLIIGPGIGLDCAVLDFGEKYLVCKSDPITFATDQIGWYLVQINANDIATTAAVPHWLLVTMLLPQDITTRDLVEDLNNQISTACNDAGISIIGGHTEITTNLDRPILIGTMLGEVNSEDLVTPKGAQPGDAILLTKGVPIEATSILAREFPGKLNRFLSKEELQNAKNFLFDPGISITVDAKIAVQSGKVTSMHDPTEGGLITALWELAEASERSLLVDFSSVHIPALSSIICHAFEIDPLLSISSGALLLTVHIQDAHKIRQSLINNGIMCQVIGRVEEGPSSVWDISSDRKIQAPEPCQDEISKIFHT